MPVEQPIPEGPRVELSAATERELCNPGAVKLLYGNLAELKAKNSALSAELQIERQRNETLTFRAHSSETERDILRERLGFTGYRDIIVRLIELVIVSLLAFAIDFAKSGNWPNLIVFGFLSLILVIVIFLIQRGHRPKGST